MEIAINAGFESGARLPGTVYYPPYFVDQNWKKPDRAKYIAALKVHRPFMASVLDFEKTNQLAEVLGWAEDAAQYVETVMIIPKAQNSIHLLPKTIGGKKVILGYSVPTSHGGTALPLIDFRGWNIHLLGGSPHRQMKLAKYLNVTSVDGNMHMLMANSCKWWSNAKGEKGHWVNLSDQKRDGDNYRAFKMSCENIFHAWEKMSFIASSIMPPEEQQP